MGVLNIDGSQKGLRFDGVNDYVNLGNVFAFERTNSFSVSFNLVRNNFSTPVQGIISKAFWDGSAYTGWGIMISNNKVFIQLANFTPTNVINVESTTTLSASVLYKCVMTYNGSSIASGVNIYINNNLVSTNILNDTLTNTIVNTGSLRIGSANYLPSFGENFIGANISDIKIFNKELNSTEVTQIFNNTSLPSNCVADYRFNQQSGTVLTDYVGGSNGTLTNYTTPETTIGSSNKWLYDFSPYPFDNSRKNGVLLINNN